MDKYEYRISLQEINKLISEHRFAEAAEIADTIDWQRVKSPETLCKISDVYKINKEYAKSRRLLVLANQRDPQNPEIIYSLCELTLFLYGRDSLQSDLTSALTLMQTYNVMQPGNPKRLILQYKMYQVSPVSVDEKISVLQQLKQESYTPKWGYELALQLYEAGRTEEAVAECRNVQDTFSGRYAKKAEDLLERISEENSGEESTEDAGEVTSPALGQEGSEAAQELQRTVAQGMSEIEDSESAPADGESADEENPDEASGEEYGSGTDYANPDDGTATETAQEEDESGNNASSDEKAPEESTEESDGTAYGPTLTNEAEKPEEISIPDVSRKQFTEAAAPKTVSAMSISQVMAQWEKIQEDFRKANQEKVSQRIMQDTGELFHEFDEDTRHGLLETIEKNVEKKHREARTSLYWDTVNSTGQPSAGEVQQEVQQTEPEAAVETPVQSGTYETGEQYSSPQQSAEPLPYAAEPVQNPPYEEPVNNAQAGDQQGGYENQYQAVPVGAPYPENTEGAQPPFYAGAQNGIQNAAPAPSYAYSTPAYSAPENAQVPGAAVSGQDMGTPAADTEVDPWPDDEDDGLATRRWNENAVRRVLAKNREDYQVAVESAKAAAAKETSQKMPSKEEAPERTRPQVTKPVQQTAVRQETPLPVPEEAPAPSRETAPVQAEVVSQPSGMPQSSMEESEDELPVRPARRRRRPVRQDRRVQSRQEPLREEYSGRAAQNKEALSENHEDAATLQRPSEAVPEGSKAEPENKISEEPSVETAEEDKGTALEESQRVERQAAQVTEKAQAKAEEEPEVLSEKASVQVPVYTEEDVFTEEPQADEIPEEEVPYTEEEASYAEEAFYEEAPEEEPLDEEPLDEEEEEQEKPEEPSARAQEEPSVEESSEHEVPAEDIRARRRRNRPVRASAEERRAARQQMEISEDANTKGHRASRNKAEEEEKNQGKKRADRQNNNAAPEKRKPREEKGKQKDTLQEPAPRQSESVPAAQRPSVPVVPHEPGRGLTDDEKKLFGPICIVPDNRRQILEAVDGLSLASYTGNILITGADGAARKVAQGILEITKHSDKNFTGKIAKASGQALNRLSHDKLIATLNQIDNGAMIVENASSISEERLRDLYHELEERERGLIVIFADTKKALDQFCEDYPEYLHSFTIRVDIRALTDKALVSYGMEYAMAKDYSIDEFGQLALSSRISAMQTRDHHVSTKEVRELVDEAISYASKKNLHTLMLILTRKRYDEDDRIIIHEKDFQHYAE